MKAANVIVFEAGRIIQNFAFIGNSQHSFIGDDTMEYKVNQKFIDWCRRIDPEFDVKFPSKTNVQEKIRSGCHKSRFFEVYLSWTDVEEPAPVVLSSEFHADERGNIWATNESDHAAWFKLPNGQRLEVTINLDNYPGFNVSLLPPEKSTDESLRQHLKFLTEYDWTIRKGLDKNDNS
jgi:hypothetical protein